MSPVSNKFDYKDPLSIGLVRNRQVFVVRILLENMCHRQLSHSNNQIILPIIYLSRDTGSGCPYAHDKSARQKRNKEKQKEM